MHAARPTPAPKIDTLTVEIKGELSTKVQIADTFRSAYQVLDRLCDSQISRLNLVYSEDFKVDQALMEEFQHAAKEALAYKEALVFGRSIDTSVLGVSEIVDQSTRAMASRLHDED